jgi:hypothetical protein
LSSFFHFLANYFYGEKDRRVVIYTVF